MTAATLTLTDFLLARIAEDEAVAKRTAERMEHMPPENIGGVGNLGIVGYPFARVLAEVEAKRRIVADHSFVHECPSGPNLVSDVEYEDGSYGGPCGTLRALAAVYADHEGFRPEWSL